MTKTELFDRVNAATAGDRHDYLTKADVEQVANAVLDQIQEALAAGEEVAVTGFGRFSVKPRAVRDPSTGADLGMRNVVSFKPGQGLKNAVNS